jgi:hypothetical protein
MGLNYVPFIEWDGLEDKYEIKNITLPENINLDTITVFRDDEYNIKGYIKGEGSFSDQLNDKLHGYGKPGQRMKPFEVRGTSDYQLYSLSQCYLGDVSTNGKLVRDETYIQQFKADFRSFEVEKRLSNNEISSLSEWYINGPYQHFLFSRSVKRENKEQFKIKRPDKEIRMNFKSESSGRDYLLVELEDFKFMIRKVPSEIGPEWSNNIAIEYNTEFGKIPNEDEREGISEIVSFLFGKQLLKIGCTEFDKDSYPIKQVSQSPWGGNVISKSRNPGFYPIRLDEYQKWGKAEVFLKELIPQYLRLRNDLNLKDALWSYWISNDVPTGIDIPILANALEILKKGWFKSTKSKSKGVYLPKKKFDELLNDSFEAIEQKLEGQEYADRILRRMKNSFNMGVNESLDFFFEEIKLPIGEIERKAIKARNSIIHDKQDSSDEEIQNIIFFSRVYRTLFHRVFLKLLSYDGEYIDYSVVGWLEKNILEATNYN